VELVRKALAADGVLFRDEDNCDRILMAGRFVLFLDGMNETQISKELSDFLVTHPMVGCIVTSQTNANAFDLRLRLRTITDNLAKSLFMQIADARSDALLEKSAKKSLWQAVRSDYDVQLLVPFFNKQLKLPDSRVALFQAALQAACTLLPDELPPVALYRLAWRYGRVAYVDFLLRIGKEFPKQSRSTLSRIGFDPELQLCHIFNGNIDISWGDSYRDADDL
jgi:hypothetical protein